MMNGWSLVGAKESHSHPDSPKDMVSSTSLKNKALASYASRKKDMQMKYNPEYEKNE